MTQSVALSRKPRPGCGERSGLPAPPPRQSAAPRPGLTAQGHCSAVEVGEAEGGGAGQPALWVPGIEGAGGQRLRLVGQGPSPSWGHLIRRQQAGGGVAERPVEGLQG